MGITLALLNEMKRRELLPRSGLRVLDIGSSNLYQADAAGVAAFVRSYQAGAGDLAAFAERMAKGSAYDAVKGGTNEAFVGELLERCGMQYLSFDIARGYRTQVFDLNREDLPRRHRGAYDVVLNIGTTEHVLNQYNSFKVIHEATRTGGCMVHQLPVSGFTDHGYFVYTGRMLFDLAAYNQYQVAAVWHEGPAGDDDVFQWTQSFAATTAPLGPLGLPSAARIPNYLLTVAFRKLHDQAFRAALDTSTSVGEVPLSVQTAYAGTTVAKLKAYVRATGVLQRFPGLKDRLRRIAGRGR